MSNPRKALGKSLEKKAAEMATEAGFEAQVQPLSGVLKEFPNDVVIRAPVASVLVECKVRSAQISGGEKYITINLDWLKGCIANLARQASAKMGVVLFRAKRNQDMYVLMTYRDFLLILENKNS